MNNLFATWHHCVEVDVREEPDVVELLARVHDGLAGIPELDEARRLVEVARGEVAAWFGAAAPVPASSMR